MELTNQPVIFVVEDNIIYQGLIAKELESLRSYLHFYTNGESTSLILVNVVVIVINL